MTINTNSVRLHAQRLAEATTRATTLSRSLHDALQRAATYKNPDLTPEALQAKRSVMAREFRAAADAELAQLRGEIDAAKAYIATAAREHVAVPNDPAALIQAEQKWRQVQTMLDAGIELRDVLSTADEQTTRAIAEFGPSWAMAKDYRPSYMEERIDRAMYGGEAFSAAGWVQETAYKRLAEVTTDPSLGELLVAASGAEANVAPARPYLDAVQSRIAGGPVDMMATAVASQIAASDAQPVAAV